MKEKNITIELGKVFWIFMIGNIFGYLLETITVLVTTGEFAIRQGLVYGPFIPVYGIGAVIYYLTFNNVKTNKIVLIFLIGMLLGGITEYLCSFIQEKLFHTISWDYSNLPFNLNGRTSLQHCIYWGLVGIFYKKIVQPLIDKIENLLKYKASKIITVCVITFMTFNITISCLAAERQFERYKNIEPKNKIDQFLDIYYSDELMDNIYSNKKNV